MDLLCGFPTNCQILCIFAPVIIVMMKEGRSKSGSVYQRPVFVHRLVPRDIILREEIMWDSKMSESDMVEVENTWDLTHCMWCICSS